MQILVRLFTTRYIMVIAMILALLMALPAEAMPTRAPEVLAGEPVTAPAAEPVETQIAAVEPGPTRRARPPDPRPVALVEGVVDGDPRGHRDLAEDGGRVEAAALVSVVALGHEFGGDVAGVGLGEVAAEGEEAEELVVGNVRVALDQGADVQGEHLLVGFQHLRRG